VYPFKLVISLNIHLQIKKIYNDNCELNVHITNRNLHIVNKNVHIKNSSTIFHFLVHNLIVM
jgi:hypothetical protein